MSAHCTYQTVKEWFYYTLTTMFTLVVTTGVLNLHGCMPDNGVLLLEDGDKGDEVDGDIESASSTDECGFTDDELHAIARQFFKSGDESALDVITNWNDAEIVIDYVAELEGYEDWGQNTDNGARWTSGLQNCGYLYGNYNFSTWANYLGSYSYLWSPNCYIGDSWGHCGPDGDNLVSFWMGPDWTSSQSDYNVIGTTATLNAWLYLKQIQHWVSGGANVRIHTSSSYGNAYFCLPTRYNPDNLRFGR